MQGTQTAVGRPGSVTAAAWILIVVGVLVALGGLLLLVAAGAVAGLLGGLAGLGLIAGILVLAIGVLHIWSGVSILGGKNWARIVGIVLGALGVLFAVLGIITALTTPAVTDPTTGVTTGGAGGILPAIIQLALYGYVLWALARTGNYFTR